MDAIVDGVDFGAYCLRLQRPRLARPGPSRDGYSTFATEHMLSLLHLWRIAVGL